jgi:hypothetical protein
MAKTRHKKHMRFDIYFGVTNGVKREGKLYPGPVSCGIMQCFGDTIFLIGRVVMLPMKRGKTNVV